MVTSLLGRPVLTPHQARHVGGGQARVRQLRIFFPRLRDLPDGLANDISSAVKDSRRTHHSVHRIQGFLFGDIYDVSTSRDLLSQAESHLYYRFRAFLGLKTPQSFDLPTHETQLQLLSTTSATVIVTIRKLIAMENVI